MYQHTGVGLAIRSLVLSSDVFWFLSPNIDFTLGLSDPTSLGINIIVIINRDDSNKEHAPKARSRCVEFWVERQIGAVNRVNRWYPHEASPAEVEACAILHDVDGLIVAAFPPEKFGNIDELEAHVYHEVSGNLAVVFLLIE